MFERFTKEPMRLGILFLWLSCVRQAYALTNTPSETFQEASTIASIENKEQGTTALTYDGSTGASSGEPYDCYDCNPGSYDQCRTETGLISCPSTSVCYLNVTQTGESQRNYSMGCLADKGECLYNGSLEQCLENETSCILCCNTKWCNLNIIDNLGTTSTEVPRTPSPPPAAEATTPSPAEVGTTPLPAEIVTTPLPAEVATTPSPSGVGTTPSPAEVGTTPLPAEEGTTPSPVEVGTTTTESSVDTKDRCYQCDSSSYKDCQDTIWSMDCPLTSVCFVNITRIGESAANYSLGCMVDDGQCHYNGSWELCQENETSCILCCTEKWCNQEIFNNLATTSTISAGTEVPWTPSPPPAEGTTPPPPTPVEGTTPSPTPADVVTTPVPAVGTTPPSPPAEVVTTLIPVEGTTPPPPPADVVTTPVGLPVEGTTPPPPSVTTPIPIEGTTPPPTPPGDEATTPLPPKGTTPPPADVVTTPSPPEGTTPPSPKQDVTTETATVDQDDTDETEVPATATPPPSQPTEAPPSSSKPTEAQPSPTPTPSTTPLATIPPRDQPLWCHQCILFEDYVLCNHTATKQHCSNVEDVCMWSINITDGVFHSTKKCQPRNECKAQSETNNATCDNFITVTGECTWCCEEGDYCNYDRGNYSLTLPPTTTSPPEVPDPCSMNDCLVQFQLLVANASKEPDLFFNEFCREVPLVFACLANATYACGTCDGGANQMLEAILYNMTAQCPAACDEVAGFNCTLSLYHSIVASLIEGGNCFTITEIWSRAEKCRIRTVGSCNSEVRESVDIAYSSIYTEIDVFCKTPLPTPSPPATTESPLCYAEMAFKCITDFGDEIMYKFFHDKDALLTICDKVELKRQCYLEYSLQCSYGVRQSLEVAWNFTYGLIAEKCHTKICDTTKARTCIVDLIGLIQTKKDIEGACKKVSFTIDCALTYTEGCLPEEQESMNSTLNYALSLIGDQCNNNIEIFANETIDICEGGEPGNISYVFKSRPSSICGSQANCRIFVDIEISGGNDPKCRNGKPIRQAVISAGSANVSSDGLCSIEATEQNWNLVQNIIVAAKIDFKYDGDQTRQLIVWYRKTVDGKIAERRSLANITVNICDRDVKDSICSSVNDPHIKTFDGWYYNNFLEGFFIMYRHRHLPYEVQIATQRCNGQAACNCAVNIRAGDTVFGIDKCRKKSFVKRWCVGRNKYLCANIMKTHIFGYDRITPGMRILSRNNGKMYVVIFPSGTQVMASVDGDYISVYITPSAMDYGNIAGLCGDFDRDATNDLMMRDRTIYKGEGHGRRQQPNGFCKNWLAAITENIYRGVAKNPHNPAVYCECGSGQTDESGNTLQCSQDALVELCDVDTSGEDISGDFEYSESDVRNDDDDNDDDNNHDENDNKNNRRKRQENADPLADYDIDPAFVANEINNNETAIAEATKMCEEYFGNTSVSKTCQSAQVANFTTSVDGCVDDILATGNTSWLASALESLKQQCEKELSQNSDISPDIVKSFKEQSCPNQCSERGNCDAGKCTCISGYSGDDCDFDLSAQPDYVELYNGLCNVTTGNCDEAQVTGTGFIPGTTKCKVQNVKVTETGVEKTGEFTPTELIYKSPTEVHCRLNSKARSRRNVQNRKALTSAYVSVSNNNDSTNSTIIIVYDPTCYTCVVLPEPRCQRLKDNCVIADICYGPGQENPADSCQVCRPTQSDSDWTYNSDSSACSQGPNIPLIVGLCVGLGGGLILLTIIIICIVYRLRYVESQKLPTVEEYETMSQSSLHRSSEFSYDNLFKEEQVEVAGSFRGGRYSTHKDGPPPGYEAPGGPYKTGVTNETFNM